MGNEKRFYTVKGQFKKQGWIYAFAEPFRIFVLYLVTEEQETSDKESLEQALFVFEYFGV